MDKKSFNRIAFVILIAIFAVILGFVSFAVIKKGKSGDNEDRSEVAIEEPKEKWQEGVIEYKGKHYKYKSNINNYLFMGIDKDGPVQEAENYLDGGQSDAMMVIIADPTKEEYSILTINRNTMTEIEVCDAEGRYMGEYIGQICLSHGYGDGRNLSCMRSVSSVEKLLDGVPIKGYIAMNLSAIPILNDAVGGVEVEILHGTQKAEKYGLVEGETVNLTGEQAYWYVRSRDTEEFDSASYRLKRQEQYIGAFFEKFKQMGNGDAQTVALYQNVEPYLVSSVDFETLIEQLKTYDYDESRRYTVPGHTEDGENFEEYYVDKDALQDLIITLFYEEVIQ